MPRRVVLLIGPAGSGKTTIAPILSKIFKVPLVTKKDLIEDEIARGTESGKYLALCRKEGKTPNDVNLVDALRIKVDDCPDGCICEDFPEYLSQAQALDRVLIENGDRENFRLLEFFIPDEVCELRLRNRWVHVASNRVYNLESQPPKSYTPGTEPCPENLKDDVTGEPLERLSLDHPLKVPKKLFQYHLGSEPIVEHFGQSVHSRVDADAPIPVVVSNCVEALAKTIFKKHLSSLEQATLSFGPLPEKTHAPEAETRVRDFGDRLERIAPVLEAKDRFGNTFVKGA